MAPNHAFSTDPAILSDGILSLSGISDPVFISPGEGVEGVAGTLVSRTVAVQQDGTVYPGTASGGESKTWTGTVVAEALHDGAALATGFESYGFTGSDPPLTATFTWTQDIAIESG